MHPQLSTAIEEKGSMQAHLHNFRLSSERRQIKMNFEKYFLPNTVNNFPGNIGQGSVDTVSLTLQGANIHQYYCEELMKIILNALIN